MITISNFDAIINILVYSAAMIILCVVFGKFWAEMSNMGPKAVAGQLQQVGLHIPGFRRDPRVVEMVLDRYIPTVTVLGSAAVGILAVVADLTGALGTGTGILLTVGILYRMYEELAAQQAFEAMPALKGLMGG
jgi:preprotein translocase subunit SecY